MSREPPTHWLPRELNTFVGREDELRQLETLLDEAPAVTLAGPGGAGKTRLALQLARRRIDEFADGVVLVELASLSEPVAVVRSVAEHLGLVEHASESVIEHVVRVLRTQELLLVLDNCEHLLPACAELAEQLLRGCPRVRLLATSREPLVIAGERVFRVPPLRLPADDRLPSLAESEAGRLFVLRALAVRADFELTDANAAPVAEICRRLDGLPLAIELAAARVAVFAPADIATRLDDAFRILTGGARTALPRQQTLAAAIGWSYDMLDDAERALFERLSVFVGGCSLAGAQAMADEVGNLDALEVLPRLVARSMVQAEPRPDGSVRYRLLGPLRQFAHDRLVDSGALASARQRMAEHILAVAEQATPDLDQPSSAVQSSALNAEADNVRAALDWAEERGDARLAIALAAALWFWWSRPDRQMEGRVWLERARSIPGTEQYPHARGRVSVGLAMMSVSAGDLASGLRMASEAQALARANGDEWLACLGLALEGVMRIQLGEGDAAEARLIEALDRARLARLPWVEARCLETLGHLKMARGDMAVAEADFQVGLALARGSLDAWSQAMALNSLADCQRAMGDLAGAGAAYEEALAMFSSLDIQRYKPQGMVHNLGYVALDRGDVSRAASLFLEAASIYLAVGDDRRGVAECVTGLGCTAVRAGRPALAARLFGCADATLDGLGMLLTPANKVEYDRGLAELTQRFSAGQLEAERAVGHGWSLHDALEAARELTAPPAAASPTRGHDLTQREYEVAVLLARGLSNRQVAEELVITEKTAKNHVQRVLDKLGLSSRAQVASRADELGLR